MSFKKQWLKVKDNWLFIVLFIFGMSMVFFLSSGLGNMNSKSLAQYDTASYGGYAEMSYRNSYPIADNSMMPNIIDRIIIKTASMNVEVKNFDSAQANMKSVVKNSQALITNENVNTAYSKYKTGHYTINVPTENYDVLIAQLKTIGELNSFNENANDITGTYIKLQDIIDAETSRLESYEKLYSSTVSVEEKIKLLDRVYDQKNTLRSLELQKTNQDERIDYSQISFTLQQKRPTHADVIFVSLGDLLSSFKASLNVMLYIIAYVLPFAVVGLVIMGVRRLVRRK